MALLDLCQGLFNTSNLYEVLGVPKEATAAEVRRSYYKVSLQVHPDRAPEDPRATEKFQVLGKVYAVLSDTEQRAVYDEQGEVDEESGALSQDWGDYWRLLFPKITVQDILEFEQKYKGSEEERLDVIQLYVKHQGDMDIITESTLCFSQEDEPRLCDIIHAAIRTGEVDAYPAFTEESDKKKKARKRRADKDRKEYEKEKAMKPDQDDSLVMMLQQRQQSREQGFNSLMADLEAKYAKKDRKTSRGRRGKK